MDYESAARAFCLLDRHSQNYITAACAKLELSYTEYVLLTELFDNEGICQDDMAKLMCVDKAVIARTIKTLEAKGFVRRVQGVADKRVRCIYATPAGRQQEAFLRGVLQRWIDYLLAGIDPEAVPILMRGFVDLGDRAGQADFAGIMAQPLAAVQEEKRSCQHADEV